jgi:hypothetical protein
MYNIIGALFMRNVKKILWLIVLILSECVAGEADTTRWELKPGKVDFPPFQASITEPRFGMSKSVATGTIKVDLGNSVDLIRLSRGKDKIRERVTAVGIDFFSYVRVTGWDGLRLQVDAIDGFFGGHITHTVPLNRCELQFRLRFLHLSAHYADGHYEQSAGQWKTNREPVPFTRDMADFTAAFRVGDFRFYGLVEHAFHIRPSNQRRTWYQAGGEWFLGHFGSRNLHPYVAQDVRRVGFESYSTNWSTILGLKWGEVYGSGINIFLRYYSGIGPYAEYSDIRTKEWSLGFSIDYW